MKKNNDLISVGQEEMSIYEFARWAALYEGVEIIANKCAERNIDFDGPAGLKYIKPLDIQDYVNTRVDSMVMTIEKARDFERSTNQTKIDGIKQRIYNFKGDHGIPV